eukprot:193394_1
MDLSDANTYFEWKVNNYLIQKWKNAKYKEGFASQKCSKLNVIKKPLKKESVRCNQMVDERNKKHDELSAKYQTLRTKRMQIHTQWVNALQQMNETIDDENTTNDAKCCAQNQYNVSELEAKQWNMLRRKNK